MVVAVDGQVDLVLVVERRELAAGVDDVGVGGVVGRREQAAVAERDDERVLRPVGVGRGQVRVDPRELRRRLGVRRARRDLRDVEIVDQDEVDRAHVERRVRLGVRRPRPGMAQLANDCTVSFSWLPLMGRIICWPSVEKLARVPGVLPDGAEPLGVEVLFRADVDHVAGDEDHRTPAVLHPLVHHLPHADGVARVAEDAHGDGAARGHGREGLRGAPHLGARGAAADLVVVRGARLQAADVDLVHVGRGVEALRGRPRVACLHRRQRRHGGAQLDLRGVVRLGRLPREGGGGGGVGVAGLALGHAAAQAEANALGRAAAGRDGRGLVVVGEVGEARRRGRRRERVRAPLGRVAGERAAAAAAAAGAAVVARRRGGGLRAAPGGSSGEGEGAEGGKGEEKGARGAHGAESDTGRFDGE